MEGYFVRTLGMHRVYNSAFMNMLKNEENHIWFIKYANDKLTCTISSYILTPITDDDIKHLQHIHRINIGDTSDHLISITKKGLEYLKYVRVLNTCKWEISNIHMGILQNIHTIKCPNYITTDEGIENLTNSSKNIHTIILDEDINITNKSFKMIANCHTVILSCEITDQGLNYLKMYINFQ